MAGFNVTVTFLAMQPLNFKDAFQPNPIETGNETRKVTRIYPSSDGAVEMHQFRFSFSHIAAYLVLILIV